MGPASRKIRVHLTIVHPVYTCMVIEAQYRDYRYL